MKSIVFFAGILGVLCACQIALAAPLYHLVDLGLFLPGRINSNGQMIGSSFSSGASHAVLYSNGTLTDLGTLGGTASRAAGINARGQIVGDSYLNGNTVDHAFLYSNGVMSDLGTLGGSNSSAVAINDLGQVVGSSQTLGHNDSSSGFEGFIYNSGVLKDIESTIGTSGFPQAINDTRQMSVDVAVNASTESLSGY
jgi:probable HAF family extracellular repeat protein